MTWGGNDNAYDLLQLYTLGNATPTKQLLLPVSAPCIETDLMFDMQEFIYPAKSQPNRLFFIF